MPQYTVQCIEERQYAVTYLIEADSEEAAEEKVQRLGGQILNEEKVEVIFRYELRVEEAEAVTE